MLYEFGKGGQICLTIYMSRNFQKTLFDIQV